jgi:hypothetical protein
MAISGPKRVLAPEPPVELGNIQLALTQVPTAWFRFSSSRYPQPIFWSRQGLYRFDSPDARWGVCYAAGSIVAAFQEVFGDKIWHGNALDWTEIKKISVWLINTPSNLRGLELFGENLTVIHATLQSFVSSYPKSQRWGAALINHPADLEGLIYLGRKSGSIGLAMLGDEKKPRRYQREVQVTRLGQLSDWKQLWPTLDRLRVRLVSMPATAKKTNLWE